MILIVGNYVLDYLFYFQNASENIPYIGVLIMVLLTNYRSIYISNSWLLSDGSGKNITVIFSLQSSQSFDYLSVNLKKTKH